MRVGERSTSSNNEAMIKGFKKETKPLNDFEKRVLDFIVPKLMRQIGKKKVVKSVEIRRQLINEGYVVTSARLRKIIHHIRIENLVTNLISVNQGYYRATEQEEVDNYVKSLQQRINAIERVKNSFINKE